MPVIEKIMMLIYNIYVAAVSGDDDEDDDDDTDDDRSRLNCFK